MRCPHCNGYIDDRPKGDFPGNPPTGQQFHEAFKTPVSFGEEGEHLLVTKEWSKEEAYAILVKELRDEWGLDEESIPSIDDVQSYDVGYGYDYDSYHYSEGGWWICSTENKVTKRWEAWGVETQ
jgi:hypothetical protein